MNAVKNAVSQQIDDLEKVIEALHSSNSTNYVSVWFNNVDTGAFNFADLNISSTNTNGLKEVVDVWEGYIDVDSQPDNNANYMSRQQECTKYMILSLKHRQMLRLFSL